MDEKTAELIARADHIDANQFNTRRARYVFDELKAALATQAQEIKTWKRRANDAAELIDLLRSDIAANFAATKERCAQVADERTLMAGDSEYSLGASDMAHGLAATIRALSGDKHTQDTNRP